MNCIKCAVCSKIKTYVIEVLWFWVSRAVITVTQNALSVMVMISLSVNHHPASILLREKDAYPTVHKASMPMNCAVAKCATVSVCDVGVLRQMIVSLAET